VIDARTCEEHDRTAFDAYVASSPAGDLLQSWEWGEIKQANGWEPIRYVAEDGGRIVAAVSILRRRPFPFGPPLLYAPRGPVFDDARALGALLARCGATRAVPSSSSVIRPLRPTRSRPRPSIGQGSAPRAPAASEGYSPPP
jgi:hypothetical protein